MTAPTEAHKAALDALETVLRRSSHCEPFSYVLGSEDDDVFLPAVDALVNAGRMKWVGASARFVTPPKPKLTAEEVEEVMGRVEVIDNTDDLRTYLTSLTQEGE